MAPCTCAGPQSWPVVGRQRRELLHPALAVVAQPADKLLPGHLPERLRAPVDVHGHVPEAQRLFGVSVAAGTGERRQVALGGVDQMADDVAGLPVLARGRRLPPRRVRHEVEHRLHLSPEDVQHPFLARGVLEVPGRIARRHGSPLRLPAATVAIVIVRQRSRPAGSYR